VLLGVYLSGVVGFVEKEFANVQKPCLKKKKKRQGRENIGVIVQKCAC
jgi:hypothetical protein